MKARHGGQAQHEPRDSQHIAALRRGGMLPQASVDPAERRATRDRLRRRVPLTRKRADLRAHVQPTNSPSHLPASGTKWADKAHRDGVAARCPAPAGQQSVDVALALMASADQRLRDVEVTLVQTAKPPHAHTRSRRPSGPGLGTLLRVVLRDEIQDMTRFPRVQAFVSSGRLVNCAKEAAATRAGTSGATLGHASRQGAFSEAAGLCLRHHPAGQKDLARLAHNHGTGHALTLVAHH